jgi:hypothetical protein
VGPQSYMTTPQRPSLADELNQRIDCEDLALRLGLERPGDRGNFKNPQTAATHSPTLSIFRGDDGNTRFYDYRTGDKGRAIDLYMLAKNCDAGTAIRELSDLYGIKPAPVARSNEPPRERSRAEWIADKALAAARDPLNRIKVMGYLCGRGLTERAVQQALDKHSLGWNDYISSTVAAGEAGHGGPGVAFVVRAPDTGQVRAVETRYIDPALNGKQKTSTQGDKTGAPWCSDWRRFEACRKVYLVESAINALSVDSCALPGVAAVSVQGAGNVRNMDWRLFIGKTVVLGFDNDKPEEQGALAGYPPGLYWAWKAHEALHALDVPCLMLDTDDWKNDDDEPINDLNDILQARGVDGLAIALKKVEPWLIPGMHGKQSNGKPRLWLPGHDFAVYWRYRVREDFTAFVDQYKEDEETGRESFELNNVCGFRVAGISRVTIASPTSTMTGDPDTSPNTIFAASVQVPRFGHRLQRRVLQDDQLHNVEVWKKLGPVFSAPNFLRMVNILERAADIGARDAVNFVGLAWKNGKPAVNEGPDCFFTDPRQQCPYSALVFPSGNRELARPVVESYQETFRNNEAALLLVWALGAHLKAYLGFWPHFVCQAEKGSGKTTLIKRLERSVGMTMFSGQSLNTEFRILTSVSYTSHPVGWEEISARKQELINKAVSNLQECYQYSHTRRGAELIDFLLCAPVLLAGEDVPVKSLTGKVVRNDLSKAKRGPQIPEESPKFPVRQWLQYLADTPKAKVRELHADAVAALASSCASKPDDGGAERMLANYGALRTAWTLLCDFAGMDLSQGGFLRDLTATMNGHIKESESDRQPWVWIVDTVLSEIARGTFRYPYSFGLTAEEEPFLALRTSHVMDHIRTEHSLREFWDSLPVKSDRVFKRALQTAGVLCLQDVERTVSGKRVAHMVGMSLPALAQYGLYAVEPAQMTSDGGS